MNPTAKKAALLTLLFVISLVIGLAVFLPARTVVGWVQPSIPQVSLQNVRGTAMRADIGQVIAAALPGNAVATDVQWRMSPLRLLLARGAGTITGFLAGGPVEGFVSASAFGTYAVSDLRGAFTVQDVLALANMEGVGVTGRVGVDLSRLKARQSDGNLEIIAADGRIDVVDLGWRFGPKRYAIGNFYLEPRVEDGVLIGAVADDEGPVAASGEVRFDPASNTYAADLKIRPRSSADPVLVNFMGGSLGRPDAQGFYTIQRNGKLRR